MRLTMHSLCLSAALLGGLVVPISALADDTTSAPSPSDGTKDEVPVLNLLEAARDGSVGISAEGTGDGRMTLSVTNRTKRALKVVLPPGLIASGATGQFGGMGGMGGMGGGMGGMGGGMGGMGGGMGGMGGGMGGMGGGMGGMGGGMGGGMMGGGTLPASMGMMMLGRLIMTLVGDRDSWDQTSLMQGMMGMGGMGGGGMGGMGGGMGGMGGMGGGMGGGFRSVPPTSLPFATLKPNQTRHLPTRLVSLSNPNAEGPVAMPEKGERLTVGEVGQLSNDQRVQAALKRLAAEKAPQTVSQLVLWHVKSGLDWTEVANLSKNWANAQELTLAREFVDRLGDAPAFDTGYLGVQISASDETLKPLAKRLREGLATASVVGLPVRTTTTDRPEGAGLSCRVTLTGTVEKPEAYVAVASSNEDATAWTPAGKFSVPVTVNKPGDPKVSDFADALADGLLSRMVRATVGKGPKVKGKDTFRVRIENMSPLVLNGVAVLGIDGKPTDSPKVLAGISVSPGKSMTVPATSQVVDSLGLKKGVRIVAADLSGL